MSRSSTPKKAKSSKPKAKAKPKKAPAKKKSKPVKKKNAAKKVLKAKAGKSKKTKKASGPAKKQPKMVKEALAAFPAAEVTHYFPKVDVAVLKIKVGAIRIGDELQFKGHTTDFSQKVVSMQIDHKPISLAQKGDDLGLKVKDRVRAGDLVYKK